MNNQSPYYWPLFFGIVLFLGSCKQENQNHIDFTEKFAKVDSIFVEYDSVSPGCVIGIVYKGELIYSKGYGMANIEENIPNTPDKLFDIASTSKQFTALSVLLLEEQGKLSLDDKIRTYIPELPLCYDPVKIKHLITHTSGIRDHYALMELTGIEEVSSEEEDWANHHYNEEAVFGILKAQNELNFAPGTFHQYCNSGFYLAGKIVERITGRTLKKYYEEELFSPLGMSHTFLYDDSTYYHTNRTMGYSNTESGYKRNLIKYETYGDGQVMTNVPDMYVWDQNFYHNNLGQKQQGLIDKAYTRFQLSDGQTVDYSLGGFEVSKYKGLTVIDRMGGTQGICSDVVRFPNQEFTVICLSNYQDLSPDPWRASLRIADIFLQKEFKSKFHDASGSIGKNALISQNQLDEIAGMYFNNMSKEYCTIQHIDGKLKWNNKDLTPVDSTHFEVNNWSMKIDFRKVDDNWTMHQQSFTFPVESYIKKDPFVANETEMKKYCGRYYCSELNLECQIIMQSPEILLVDSNNERFGLDGLFKDTFKSKYNGQDVVIEFYLNQNNTGQMKISTSWIKVLTFNRM
jgi:CubicO group peptidase (beta-lactamase class C family)